MTADELRQQLDAALEKRRVRDDMRVDLAHAMEEDPPSESDLEEYARGDLREDARLIDLMTWWVAAELKEAHHGSHLH